MQEEAARKQSVSREEKRREKENEEEGKVAHKGRSLKDLRELDE